MGDDEFEKQIAELVAGKASRKLLLAFDKFHCSQSDKARQAEQNKDLGVVPDTGEVTLSRVPLGDMASPQPATAAKPARRPKQNEGQSWSLEFRENKSGGGSWRALYRERRTCTEDGVPRKGLRKGKKYWHNLSQRIGTLEQYSTEEQACAAGEAIMRPILSAKQPAKPGQSRTLNDFVGVSMGDKLIDGPFLAGYRKNVKPATIEHFRHTYDPWIREGLGKQLIGNITWRMIQELCDAAYQAAKAKPNGTGRVALRIKTYLSQIFDEARRFDIVQGNPTELVRLPKMKGNNGYRLSPVDAIALVHRLANPIKHLSPAKRLQQLEFLVAIALGFELSVNIGENQGLLRARVNSTEQDILVDGFMIPAHCIGIWENFNTKMYLRDDTKNDYRARALPLGRLLEKLIIAWLDACPHKDPSTPLFPDRYGHEMKYQNSLARLKRITGDKSMTWTALRRTFKLNCRLLRPTRVPHEVISMVMGHASLHPMNEVYDIPSHYDRSLSYIDEIKPWVERIDEALLGGIDISKLLPARVLPRATAHK